MRDVRWEANTLACCLSSLPSHPRTLAASCYNGTATRTHLPWLISHLLIWTLHSWGFFMTPPTILWHMKSKMPERVIEANQFAKASHCPPSFVRLKCQQKPWASCNGQSWRRCIVVYNLTTCPVRMVNLHHTSRARQAARHECWEMQDMVGYTDQMSFRAIG